MVDDWDDPVTETLSIEEKAGTSEFRAVSQDKGLLIVLVGPDHNRTFTIESEAVIGRSVEASIQLSCEDVSRLHARIYQTMPGQFIIEDFESTNGTLVNGIPVTKQLLKFGDKIRVGTKSILMFTQYDRLEDQLLQSQRLESIGQLAGGVAHDFNNILGAMLANVGFLKGLSPRITFGDREVRNCLEDIDTAARRAVDLTRQLLGLARRDNKVERPVDLGKVALEVAQLIGRTFDKAIAINTDIEADITVMGDPSQLHQMLMNLCINARDAMPSGGTLTLGVRGKRLGDEETDLLTYLRPGYYAQMWISDTGIGMDEHTRRRAFEPFFTTKGRGEGTGLGLATVYSIIKRHGGHVDLESELGGGTTFRILLPATEVAEETLPVEEFNTKGTGKVFTFQVLLVDDEEVFLTSTRRLLEGLGYPVWCAKDGKEAIRIFQEHKETIELVLLDMIMPNMSGTETFEGLRRIDPTVRVLLCSGHTELSSVRRLLAEGAVGFLQKPYDAGALGEAISRAIYGPSKKR